MNVNEFREEFNLGYNNTLGPGAPGLDPHEVSVYLTTAQEEIVKELYTGNVRGMAFEQKEYARRTLNELVKEYKTNDVVASTRNIIDGSVFYSLPEDLMFILNERVIFESTDSCLEGKRALVKPITLDQFEVDLNNPFRKPNKNKAWRLDISKEKELPVVEVYSKIDIKEYQIRYMSRPSPIIIVDLNTDPQTAGLGLSIDGITTLTECKLNPLIHREILNRAIELACRDNRENTLQTQIQTHNRI